MRTVLTGGMVWRDGAFYPHDLTIDSGRVVSLAPARPSDGTRTIPLKDHFIVPGFADVHVHLREPGFSYKETIATGTAAAAAGGYTQVLSMPNLNPVPDSLEHLAAQRERIERGARVHVLPYGAVTRGEQGGELADLEALAPYVAGFSDDGRGVQDEAVMRKAMRRAAALGKPIAAHCEVNALLRGGCIHDGAWARARGFPGICSESEWGQVERDLRLVEETGCRYHVCHVSTKESVALIRGAKRRGLPVTCETAPHYLILCDEDLRDEGRFKMNPPLRGRADREALLEGLLDGTVDCIATDHAPHAAGEKDKGLRGSLMGVAGLETALAALYTRLVEPGLVPLSVLFDRLITRPRRIFGLSGGTIEEGAPADLTVLDLHADWTVEPERFYSKGRATPFAGERMRAKVIMTFCEGELVYAQDRDDPDGAAGADA